MSHSLTTCPPIYVTRKLCRPNLKPPRAVILRGEGILSPFPAHEKKRRNEERNELFENKSTKKKMKPKETLTHNISPSPARVM
jgi:hypothetical protein